MAFSMKQTKCKTCGEPHLVPAGKLSGMGYKDCPKCRDKEAETADAETAEQA